MAKKPIGPIRRTFAPWEDPEKRPFIEFRNVTKRFGSFTAVDNLSQTIYEREFFALLGGSGCGKTTLMRMLAGFEQPTEGEIFLDGQNLAGVPPYRRPVNMMFQSYALFPHMSVEANIAFGLKQDGFPKADIADRVKEMLRLVKLEPFGKRKPHQLSGGQRQRVALARSLAKRPKVLLLDEPLAALDKKLREETQFELMDLQMDLGMTFLIVTHDQEEAMTVADRIAVMDAGRIIQVATPSEIYESPNSRYVADFIGDINLIESKVVAKNGETTRLRATELDIEFDVAQTTDADIGDAVAFGIRPEKITVTMDKPDADFSVHAEIWDIGYLGDVSTLHCRTEDGHNLRAGIANVTRLVERPLTWDDKIWMTWRKDAGVILRH
ncbi:ABC transporter ATP-binding protein [Breoghania corrubedonensis]|uniref:ABC transporter ATP-binding protein n=1 Tax=Breoghania corrubedonensis TaxID=665038 RepID=UPI001FE83566|nr:ABC transporter ATP-binding protein [Breoghania corrubedonensis]